MKRPIHAQRAGNRGFTIIEAIIVMAILSIVMMAVMSIIIPTRHSMSMQSKVTDVQSNLNLAMNVITRDLLMAGFLVDPAFDPPITDPDCPTHWKGDAPSANMAAGPVFWQGTADGSQDNDDLTIRSRFIGNAFAVVVSEQAANTQLALTHGDMHSNFCNGDVEKVTHVRIFNPVTATDPACTASDYSCDMDPADVAASLETVTCDDGQLTISRAVTPSTVIVGTRANALPMQTIRYRVNAGALERIVNGSTQILARGVTSVNFGYGNSSTGTINRVDVALTGVIAAIKPGADAQLSQKTRTLISTVTLRNSF